MFQTQACVCRSTYRYITLSTHMDIYLPENKYHTKIYIIQNDIYTFMYIYAKEHVYVLVIYSITLFLYKWYLYSSTCNNTNLMTHPHYCIQDTSNYQIYISTHGEWLPKVLPIFHPQTTVISTLFFFSFFSSSALLSTFLWVERFSSLHNQKEHANLSISTSLGIDKLLSEVALLI
jgi:hypothetical protein